MRKRVRRLSNESRTSGSRAQFKEALTEFNREIRRSRRRSWRSCCEEIDSLSEAARMSKNLSKDHTNGIGSLRRPDGTLTESPRETIEVQRIRSDTTNKVGNRKF